MLLTMTGHTVAPYTQWNQNLAVTYQQMSFQLVGFDRLNFVGDVTNAIPQNEQCRITNLLFEGDGIRATGCLTVLVTDPYFLALINRQLRSVRGLIRVDQTN